MKYILLILFLMLLKCAGAQWEPGASVGTYKILNDTTRIYSQRTDGRGNELIIKNQSFLTGQKGVLTNRNRGLSYWRRSQMINDSSFNVGDDTLSIRFPQTKILDRLCIYQENTEWTTNVVSGTGFDPNSTDFPCDGAKSIEGTAVGNNDVMTLSAPGAPPDYSGYNYLTLEISSKGVWAQGQRLRLRFTNGSILVGTSVNIGEGSSNFKSSITDSCQLLWIPMASFGNITGADGLRIVGAIQFTGSIGFYLDNICLVQTTTPVTPPVTEFQGWQSTLDVDPNLYHDNLTNANNTDWYIDSMKRLTVHVTDQLRLIGDVESGREITQTWYVNDNPFTYGYQGNATHVNGIYAPLFGAYLSAYPHPVPNGVMSFRASIHPNNDIVGADASFEFSASIANNDTTANNAIQPLQHQQINKPILFVRGVNESTGFTDSMMEIFPTGQQQWAHYGEGNFVGTPTYFAAYDALGNHIEVNADSVGGSVGGGTETDPVAIAKTITEAEGYGILSPETNTQTIGSNPSYSVAVDTNLITSKPYLYKVTDSIIGLIPPTTGDTNFIRNQYTHREAKNSWYDTAMLQRVRMSSATTPQVMVMEGNGGFLWRRTNSNGAAFNITSTGLSNGRIQFSADYTGGSGSGKSPILQIIDTANVTVWNFNSGNMTFQSSGNKIFIDNQGSYSPNATTRPNMKYMDGKIQLMNTPTAISGITDGVNIYAEDVAASSELKVRDEAGNISTLSPHDFTGIPNKSNKLAWSSYHELNGEYVNVDMYKALKQIEKQDAEIEELKKEVAELKGMIYHKKKTVKLIYTGKVKK